MKPYNAMYKAAPEKKEDTQQAGSVKVVTAAEPETKPEKKAEPAPKENRTVYEPAKKKIEKDAKVARCDMVNVRKDASIMAPVLEIIDRNTTVKTFGKEGEFTKVKTARGIEGFIMSDYLDEV